MKKLSVLFTALMVVAQIGVVRAEDKKPAVHDDDRGQQVDVHSDGGDGAGGLLAFLVSVETMSTTTVASGDDEKAINVANVLDDASAYLQPNGEESSTLHDAISLCREDKGATGTDREIAARLLAEAGAE